MSYSIPPYVSAADVGNPQLRFKWDDWRASQDFEYNPNKVLERLLDVSLRARIAVGIGMYEWIIWRFRSSVKDLTPFQVAQAAWCASVHREYMEYIEFDRKAWLGPVNGPLWCAMTWLMPMVLFSDDNPDECESGLSYLCRLAVHVLPSPVPFQQWLDKCTERLIGLYPEKKMDAFEDLFGENQTRELGPLVPSEVLDPTFPFSPEKAAVLIDRFLRSVDYRSNPLLRHPDVLLAEGFVGNPYQLNRD